MPPTLGLDPRSFGGWRSRPAIWVGRAEGLQVQQRKGYVRTTLLGAMDREALLGHASEIQSVWSGSMLRYFEVETTGRRKDALPRVVCGQNETFLVWHAERLPCNGSDSQPPGGNPKWWWFWGCSRGRVASCGMPEILFTCTKLILQRLRMTRRTRAESTGWTSNEWSGTPLFTSYSNQSKLSQRLATGWSVEME